MNTQNSLDFEIALQKGVIVPTQGMDKIEYNYSMEKIKEIENELEVHLGKRKCNIISKLL